MRRLRLWLVAIVLMAASVALPVLAALRLSSTMATHAQLQRLKTFDRRVIQRAQAAFRGATQALRAMASTDLVPCSPVHLEAMRKVAANNRFIGEVGYFDDAGMLRCTSWGVTTVRVARRPPQFQTDEGIDAANDLERGVVATAPRTALFLGHYDVLLHPKVLVDVVVTPDIQLAIASARAGLIATQNEPDPRLVESLLVEPRQGYDERYLFSAQRAGTMIGIAIQSRQSAADILASMRSLLLPVAGLISAALAAGVIFMIRRRGLPPARLAAAVRSRAIGVQYQPIIELASGACVGAEALARWRREDGSLVPADDFIPLAEKIGLISQITEQVIDRVLEDMRDALVRDRSLHIGINLSAPDVTGGRIIARIRHKLIDTGIASQQIWLELTERGFIDIERARSTVLAAHQLGYAIAIDDFGTGYSSLQYLQTLPLDTLKIDKSFIDTIGRVTATSSVTPHIIDMARTLNLYCIAEGIETEAQLVYLKARGVQFGQGWLFSKALPAAGFIAFCKARRARYGAPRLSLRSREHPRWSEPPIQPEGDKE